MFTKSKLIIYMVGLLVILVSCTSAPTQIPSVDNVPTSLPTNTLVVESTSALVSTNTPETKIIILEESTSPNGDWVATTSLAFQERNKNLVFKVSNKTTNEEWFIEKIEWNELQTPSSWVPFPYVFQWSQDNNFLYYSYEPNNNDGCFGYFRPGGFGLNRLDLNTGEIVFVRNDKATWMALSPDEKKLAYIDTFGGNVSILEIENGKTQTFPLPPIKNEMGFVTDTSDLYWSPDGKSLIYAHYVGACDLLIPISYIVQLFPDTGQQQVLINHSEQGYIPEEWSVQGQILLRDLNGNRFWLNSTTKEIIPADS
jgi:Tol biopolymer transport system component